MKWMMVMAVVAVAAGGCKKKPALVKTPVMELDPVGGARPAPTPATEEENSAPAQPVAQPAATPDGGVARQKVMVAPRTTNTPTVASPYVPGGGRDRLPMWRQRAKFY
jgi:hypothetical protein